MEKNLIVLNNAANGLFITHDDKLEACDVKTNPRVSNDIEIAILTELKKAVFVKLKVGVERAETNSYVFYKYEEDAQEDITWVEQKGSPGSYNAIR